MAWRESWSSACRWFDNSIMTTFRGSLYYDGGLTNFIPLPPDVSVGVRVCCLPARQLNTLYPIDITPDAFEQWPYSAGEVCLDFLPALNNVTHLPCPLTWLCISLHFESQCVPELAVACVKHAMPCLLVMDALREC